MAILGPVVRMERLRYRLELLPQYCRSLEQLTVLAVSKRGLESVPEKGHGAPALRCERRRLIVRPE